MALLKIDLQEGFAGDTVVIQADGKEVFQKRDVKTRLQIGHADSIQVDVPEGEVNVRVELPEKNLAETIPVQVTAETRLSVNLSRDGRLILKEEPEGFRYA